MSSSSFRPLDQLLDDLAALQRWDEFQSMLAAMAEAQRFADRNQVQVWIWRRRRALGDYRYLLAPYLGVAAEPWLLVQPRPAGDLP